MYALFLVDNNDNKDNDQALQGSNNVLIASTFNSRSSTLGQLQASFELWPWSMCSVLGQLETSLS